MLARLLVALFAVLAVVSCPVRPSASPPAPSPTPTPTPILTPTPTYTPTSTQVPSSTPSSPGKTGSVTYFYQKGKQGACGRYSKDSDYVAAIGINTFYSLGKDTVCGQKISIYNQATGKHITVTIADACDACELGHLDLSVAAFVDLSDNNLSQGDIPVQLFGAADLL